MSIPNTNPNPLFQQHASPKWTLTLTLFFISEGRVSKVKSNPNPNPNPYMYRNMYLQSEL